ncbi:MAG: MrpF/PhaF family protein, partial [Gemmatimonadota bacterium]|nr:MrpF/PhaF family protein [Gemmatimonadota bacterium]
VGRPEFLDLALVYALINFIGTIAVLKYFEVGDLGKASEIGGRRS